MLQNKSYMEIITMNDPMGKSLLRDAPLDFQGESRKFLSGEIFFRRLTGGGFFFSRRVIFARLIFFSPNLKKKSTGDKDELTGTIFPHKTSYPPWKSNGASLRMISDQ